MSRKRVLKKKKNRYLKNMIRMILNDRRDLALPCMGYF